LVLFLGTGVSGKQLSLIFSFMSADHSQPGRDGFAGWGFFVGGFVGTLPALILGGRWWSVALFLAVAGWLIGAFIDRERS
jgi:VIT1/CCC1 family predicted Fe2+/Mn2+ transporter